jgi:hypothetical protein
VNAANRSRLTANGRPFASIKSLSDPSWRCSAYPSWTPPSVAVWSFGSSPGRPVLTHGPGTSGRRTKLTDVCCSRRSKRTVISSDSSGILRITEDTNGSGTTTKGSIGTMGNGNATTSTRTGGRGTSHAMVEFDSRVPFPAIASPQGDAHLCQDRIRVPLQGH